MTCPFSICQLRLWLFNIAFLQICIAAIYAKYCSQNLFFVSKLASCWSWSRQYFFSLPKAWMEMEFWHWIVLLTLYLPSLVSGLWFCKNWTFFCSILSNYKKIGAVMWAPWNKLKFLYWHPKYQWNLHATSCTVRIPWLLHLAVIPMKSLQWFPLVSYLVRLVKTDRYTGWRVEPIISWANHKVFWNRRKVTWMVGLGDPYLSGFPEALNDRLSLYPFSSLLRLYS